MKHTALLLSLLMLGGGVAIAQDPDIAGDPKEGKHENGNSLVVTRPSQEDKEILKKTKPEGPHEIPVPNFVIKTKNNKFLMSIGGQINTIVGWDLGNNLYQQGDAGINFVTQDIPVPSVKGHKHDFYINPYNAAIDFQIVGLAGTDNQISGYIKLATNGNNGNINLSKAFLTWRGFTAGLKHTLIQDGAACQPPTIDPEGPSGEVSNNSYEISYTSKNYDGFQFALGLDMPSFCSSRGVYRGHDYPTFDGKMVTNYADAEQMVPDIPMWVQYTFSENNRIRVSGVIRNFAYRDLLTDKTRNVMGWGVMLSGNIQPVKPLILYYQAIYGQGLGNYIQDLSGMPISFTPKNDEPGRMHAAPMMGIDIGATVNITDKLQFNIMGSEARVWDVADYATVPDNNANYKYALYGAANLFYNVTSYLQFGVEYLYGTRHTWNMGSGHDNRIQAQVMFTL